MWVMVDRRRIREMLLNLVTNAIKYTPAEGKVELSLTTRSDGAAIIVRDTGIGIASNDLPHIFERFWRADLARSRTGERPGSGLGLAITKWIAEAHGGIDYRVEPAGPGYDADGGIAAGRVSNRTEPSEVS